MIKTFGMVCVLSAILIPVVAFAAPPAPRTAVFDFELIDTSPAPPSPAEIQRTKDLSDQLRAALAKSGHYEIVDIAPIAASVAAGPAIRDCNGCERDYANKLGAKIAAFGWIQKVSDLILNINLVIEDASTGKILNSASTDIRGNTDESWSRGLKFMLDDRVFDQ